MQRDEIIRYLNDLLDAESFRDYAPNGLQVEGKAEVNRILLGVTASQAMVDAAAERGADMLLVHHGWFWKGEPAVITGMKRRRLAKLLSHDINLVGYHIPLDAHPTLGNNAELARLLSLKPIGRAADMDLVWICEPEEGTLSLAAFVERVSSVLDRAPLVLGHTEEPLTRIALCTGAAQDWISVAAEHGAQLYLSGEVSERTTHEAVENDIVYLAAGHHATERFGIQALGRALKEAFPSLDVSYLEINNPV